MDIRTAGSNDMMAAARRAGVMPRRVLAAEADHTARRPRMTLIEDAEAMRHRAAAAILAAPLFHPKRRTDTALFDDLGPWEQSLRRPRPQHHLTAAQRDRVARSHQRIQALMHRDDPADAADGPVNIFADDPAGETTETTPPAGARRLRGPDHRFRRLRRDFCDAEDRVPVQQRVLVHVLNTAMIAAAPPVGAALAVYSCLRGENVRLSAYAMVAVGVALGALQTVAMAPLT